MHKHLWNPLSSHSTSDGVVTYFRCACGAHVVDLTVLRLTAAPATAA